MVVFYRTTSSSISNIVRIVVVLYIYPIISPSIVYILPLSRFEIISRPVILDVAHRVGKSRVLEKVSAYPKKSIGGIQPRAYSRAKHDSSILYCLTSPRRRWCTLPWG